MRDMIYFPGFEVKDENWLKFALLYFDTLRPIIPYTIAPEEEYISDRFRHVMEETDLIVPYRPEYEEGNCASILACEEFKRFLSDPNICGLYFCGTKSANYIDKWRSCDYQDCTLFEGKYSEIFFDFCVKNGIATPCKEGINISHDLAFVYMSFLADIISKKNELEMISDIDRYSSYMINKDIYISREKQKDIALLRDHINLFLPENISKIPLERIVELRKERSFNEARKAYIAQVEKFFASHERGKDFSEEELLSYGNELISIIRRAFGGIAAMTVFCFSFYDAINGQKTSIPAMASVVVDAVTAKNEYDQLPQYVNSIREKRLAKKYITKIKGINKHVI